VACVGVVVSGLERFHLPNAGDEPNAGVLDLTDSADRAAVLEETPVGDVWGVGPAYAKLFKGAASTRPGSSGTPTAAGSGSE